MKRLLLFYLSVFGIVSVYKYLGISREVVTITIVAYSLALACIFLIEEIEKILEKSFPEKYFKRLVILEVIVEALLEGKDQTMLLELYQKKMKEVEEDE